MCKVKPILGVGFGGGPEPGAGMAWRWDGVATRRWDGGVLGGYSALYTGCACMHATVAQTWVRPYGPYTQIAWVHFNSTNSTLSFGATHPAR